MSRSGRYKVKFRRRREGKTDFRRRLALLKSRDVRMVVRVTNRYILVQFVKSKLEGDEVVVGALSKELRKHGWAYCCKNTPAAYLTGYLAAAKAKRLGVSTAVLDVGRYPSTRGSRLYAALKGALDAGIDVPHSKEVLPSEERIRGEHVSSWAIKLKDEDPEMSNRLFSGYLEGGAPPGDIPGVFETTLERISSGA